MRFALEVRSHLVETVADPTVPLEPFARAGELGVGSFKFRLIM